MHWADAAALALTLLAALLLARMLSAQFSGEGFAASPEARQLAAQANELFSRHGGEPPYAEFRARVRADPVQFAHLRRLRRATGGPLTGEQVEQFL